MTIDVLETSRRARILLQVFPRPAELLTGLRGGRPLGEGKGCGWMDGWGNKCGGTVLGHICEE